MGIIYSTEKGDMCPACGNAARECVCRLRRGIANSDGIVRVSRQIQGRKGKGVTVIAGLGLSALELENLASQCKRRLGTGGTVKNGCIEIQGDHRDAIVEYLCQKGYKAKRAGG